LCGFSSYNRYSYVINNPLKYTDPDGYFFVSLIAAVITKAIVASSMHILIQVAIAYTISYAATYIATGNAKAAQGAGLAAGLFMGIGGLRGGEMGANGKMQTAAIRETKKYPSGSVYLSGLLIT
jgi:hypothetical protein